MRTRDVDRAELCGQVDQVRVQLEPVDPVAEPRLHPVGATRRRRHVVGPVGERGDEPVVHHVAGLVEREQVASSAGSDRADVQREHAVEEHPCVPTGDEELAERRDVHQAHALAHRADLIGDVAVRAGAEPHAGVVDPRAGLDVPVVQGGPALDLFVDPADQVTQPRRANRWAGGRAAAGRDPGALRAGVLREVSRAQRPLARAHRRRRVALQDLRGGPTLVPGLLEVVHRDVLAHADVPVRLGDGPRVGLSGLVRFTPARGASGPFGVIDRASRQNDVAGADDLGVGSHPKEGVAGRPAEGEHQCIACEGTAALGGEHRDGAHLLGAACFQDAAGDQRDLGCRPRGWLRRSGHPRSCSRRRRLARRPGPPGSRPSGWRRGRATRPADRCRGTPRAPPARRSRRSRARPRPRRAPRVRPAPPTGPRIRRSPRAPRGPGRRRREPRPRDGRSPIGSWGRRRARRGRLRRRGAREPSAAALAAAASPATPPPITSVRVRTNLVGVRVVVVRSGRVPVPVARRITRSAIGQSHLGRANTL